MSTVPGDPASLSSCASTVRAVADLLGPEAEQLAAAVAALADGWGGRRSALTRARGARLAASAESVGEELRRVAAVLQDQATDLADLVARARRIEERAAAAGLELRDGRVVPGWGVTGPADPAAERRAAEAAAALQAELDLVRAQHTRRRDWVLGVLRESGERLASLSHALRRG